MTTSNETQAIANALVGFHKDIGKIKKDAQNPFFKSSYATLSNILSSIDDPLTKNGLTYVQFPTGAHGLTTRLMHISGEWMEDTSEMTPSKNDPQGIGSAQTYQRRYSLAAILGLNIDNDDDGNAASMPTGKTSAKVPRSPKVPVSDEDNNYSVLKGKVLATNDLAQLELMKAKLIEAEVNNKLPVTIEQFKDLTALINGKLKRFSLKDTKADARNTAEFDTAGEPEIHVE